MALRQLGQLSLGILLTVDSVASVKKKTVGNKKNLETVGKFHIYVNLREGNKYRLTGSFMATIHIDMCVYIYIHI